LTIKKFFVFSIVVHGIVGLVLYFMPQAEVKKPEEFHASLVSPEELLNPGTKNLQKIKPAVPLPKTLKKMKSLPPQAHSLPLSKPQPPSAEKPEMPGEGKKRVKSLPGGGSPKPGGGKEGEREIKDTKNARESAKPGFSGGASLFDRKTIEEIARRDTGYGGYAGKQGDRDNPITFDTQEYLYEGYMTKLREKIESIWEYPPEEAAKGHYGDLKIRFTIKKDGRLGEVVVERTSGYPSLDKAALKALRDGEPYWPLPDAWHKDSYAILGHFIYSLYGSHLR
jgi:protein TonB